MTRVSTILNKGWFKVSIYAALIFGIYHSTLQWLILKDWARDAYNYAYLMPFIVFYLIWMKRDRLNYLPSKTTWVGLLPIGVGLLLFWVGELGGEFFTIYLSLWILTVGLCWLHLGWTKLKEIIFPLFICLTMFPLPNFLYTKITIKLQLISSKLGVKIIHIFGLPAYREGNIIDIGFTQLQVVEACSGLHSLISLFVLGILVAYFFKENLLKRSLLLLSTIPLAIFTNSLRIALTSVFYKHWGPAVAEGFFHGFSGFVIFLICLPVLYILMKFLSILPPKRKDSSNGNEFTNSEHPKIEVAQPVKNYTYVYFIITVILLTANLAIGSFAGGGINMPLKVPLIKFPNQIGPWLSEKKLPLEQNILNSLDLSDYVLTNYRNQEGRHINFYMAYYETQSKGKSIHSPATCLPGSGWEFLRDGKVKLSTHDENNEPFEISRAKLRNGDRVQIVYFFFYLRGRIITNAYQVKFYNVVDSITKGRTDGAMVRLITPVYENEDALAADKRLENFLRDLEPLLKAYIPS